MQIFFSIQRVIYYRNLCIKKKEEEGQQGPLAGSRMGVDKGITARRKRKRAESMPRQEREGRKPKAKSREEVGRSRDKERRGGFMEGTGPGLYHTAIKDKENSYSQREYGSLTHLQQ